MRRSRHISDWDERRSGWRTIRKVAPYLWPDDQPWVKRRVVIALSMLVLAKVIAVYTPILYKGAVDMLAGEGVPPLALGAVGLTVAYGVARLMTVGFQQLRDAVFARVGQRALRPVVQSGRKRRWRACGGACRGRAEVQRAHQCIR